MARRRRPESSARIVGGTAELIVPIESVITADDQPISPDRLGAVLGRVPSYPGDLTPSPSVSVVLDRFAFDLHIGDIAVATGTHAGDAFADAARDVGSVSVYVTEGLDPRRGGSDLIAEAAASGRVRGGAAAAFIVDLLPEP